MTNKPASSSAGTLAATPFSFTAAQIRASATAPITVVSAPGATQALALAWVVYGYTFVSVAYGSGYFTVAGPIVSVTGNAAGSSVVGIQFPVSPGSAARASVVNQPITFALAAAGPIATSTLLSGGGLFAANDTGNLTGGSGSGATYRVNTVDGTGAVLTYTITAAGTGYQIGDVCTLTPAGAQPGLGSGAQVTVATVDTSGEAGNGLIVGTVYSIVSTV